MSKETDTKNTVDKLAKNKKAPQTDAESKKLQKLGSDMAAPNDNKALNKPATRENP